MKKDQQASVFCKPYDLFDKLGRRTGAGVCVWAVMQQHAVEFAFVLHPVDFLDKGRGRGFRAIRKRIGQDLLAIERRARSFIDEEVALNLAVLPESVPKPPREIAHAIHAWLEAGDDLKYRSGLHLVLSVHARSVRASGSPDALRMHTQ
jgi:hypothetical protein